MFKLSSRCTHRNNLLSQKECDVVNVIDGARVPTHITTARLLVIGLGMMNREGAGRTLRRSELIDGKQATHACSMMLELTYLHAIGWMGSREDGI